MGKGSVFWQDTLNERQMVAKDNIRIIFFMLVALYLSYCVNGAHQWRAAPRVHCMRGFGDLLVSLSAPAKPLRPSRFVPVDHHLESPRREVIYEPMHDQAFGCKRVRFDRLDLLPNRPPRVLKGMEPFY